MRVPLISVQNVAPVYFHVNPQYTYVTNPPDLLRRKLTVSILSDKVKNIAKYNVKFRQRLRRAGIESGEKCLFDLDKGRMPSGLVPWVVSVLREAGYLCELSYSESKLLPSERSYHDSELQGIDLYPFQRSAIDRLVNGQRGILEVATGGGKTEIIAGVFKKFSDRKAVFLTHRKDLLAQTVERLRFRLQEEIGIVGAGIKEQLNARIICAMVPTLAHKSNQQFMRELLTNCDIVVADECHHASSKSWYHLLMTCTAPLRYGVSATALMTDDLRLAQLMGAFGPVLFKASASWLIFKGYLARPEIRLVTYNAPTFSTKRGTKYTTIETQGIMECEEHHSVTIKEALRYAEQDLKTLILLQRIPHGKLLAERLSLKLGIEVPFLYGKVKLEEREKHKKQFLEGKHKIIIATTIYDEGVDIPNIQAEILAGGGKSPIRSMQRLGRGLRITEGKYLLKVSDIAPTHHKTLAEHTLMRLTTYKKEPAFIIDAVHL